MQEGQSSARETESFSCGMRELRVVAGLAPVLFAPLRARWHRKVLAVDASEHAQGMVVADIKDYNPLDLATPSPPGQPPSAAMARFVQSSRWTTIVSSPWRDRETLYGVLAFMPQLKDRLPVATRCVKMWLKGEPSTPYPPLSWNAAVAMAVQLARGGSARMGLAVVLAHDCMLRVSELVALRAADVYQSPRKGRRGLTARPSTTSSHSAWPRAADL
jgi:hypothetical protein